MTAIYIICFILLVVGAALLLKLTPDQINKDISEMFDKKQSLKDKSLEAKGKKKTNKLILELNKIRRALDETGKGKQFSFACAAALVLMVAGCVLALAIDNPFLIPVLCVAFAIIPFAYVKRMIGIYENQVKEELETALSVKEPLELLWNIMLQCLYLNYDMTEDFLIQFENNAEAISEFIECINVQKKEIV